MSEQTIDPELPIEIESDVEITRGDRVRRIIDTYIVTPGKIIIKDKRAILGISIVFIYAFIGIFGTWLIEPTTLWEGERLEPPFQSWEHPLGTDASGRDLLTLLVYGTRPILMMVLSGALFATAMATFFGVVSGYAGGRIDQILSTITDIALTIPGLPLVIVLAVTLEPSHPFTIGILLTINAWGGLARNIRSQVLTIRNTDYVEASKAMGISTRGTIFKDVLPNMMPYILYNLMSSSRRVIFASVGLYYLGVLPYEQENWGVILDQAHSGGGLTSAAIFHWILFPMVVIVVLSVGLILLGQSADKLFNPRVRARHESSDGKVSDLK